MSGMEKQETSSAEIARTIENFESHAGHDFGTNEKLRHENIISFKDRFSLDVKRLLMG